MAQPSDAGATQLHQALASVARAIADSLEIRTVWDRVAEACRTVVPFDAMGISILASDGTVRARSPRRASWR